MGSPFYFVEGGERLKKITIDNWLEFDTTASIFVRRSEETNDFNIPHRDKRVEEFLIPVLCEETPKEVIDLFEVARGCMSYGYFFYPLYTLGIEQLYRVLEAAVSMKCKSLDSPKSIKQYKQKIDYLIEMNIIPVRESELWHVARKLRNSFSHTESQSILFPMDALNILCRIAEKINILFQER